jgi:Sucrose synthase
VHACIMLRRLRGPGLHNVCKCSQLTRVTCIPAQPEFIIGNYSDGNLVASLLSNYMGVTQCNIAHALEKTKYSDADIHWCGVKSSCHWQIVWR